MSATFTKGPYQRDGRSVFKLVDNPEPKRGRPDQINLWLASVQPCGEAVETAELEAVARLFQASPLLQEALRHTCKYLCQWKDTCEVGCPVSAALAAATTDELQSNPSRPCPTPDMQCFTCAHQQNDWESPTCRECEGENYEAQL